MNAGTLEAWFGDMKDVTSNPFDQPFGYLWVQVVLEVSGGDGQIRVWYGEHGNRANATMILEVTDGGSGSHSPSASPSGTPSSSPSGTAFSSPSGTASSSPSGTADATPSAGTPSGSPSASPVSPSEGTPSGSPSGSPGIIGNAFYEPGIVDTSAIQADMTLALCVYETLLTPHDGMIRLKFAHLGTDYVVQNVWIGNEDIGNSYYDYYDDGTARPVLWGGQAQTTITATNTESDLIDFPIHAINGVAIRIEVVNSLVPYKETYTTGCIGAIKGGELAGENHIPDVTGYTGEGWWPIVEAIIAVDRPSSSPSEATPSDSPSQGTPSGTPSASPSASPSSSPSATPSGSPSGSPSGTPSASGPPSPTPSASPSGSPSQGTPSGTPSSSPSEGTASGSPSEATPSGSPSGSPSGTPSSSPSQGTPSGSPSVTPSGSPSSSPSEGTPSTLPSSFDYIYGFDTYTEASTNWDYWFTVTGIHTLDNVSSVGRNWCWTTGTSGSSNTGPPGGSGCVYPETSSPSIVGDEATCTLKASNACNAQNNEIVVNAVIGRWGNTAGRMYLEAWDGTDWQELYQAAGWSTSSWQTIGPFDCSSFTNTDFIVRWRVVTGGTSYQNDFPLSYLRIQGYNRYPSPSGSPSEATPSGSPSFGTPSDTPSASPSGSPSGSPSHGTPSDSPSASPSGSPSGSPSHGTPSDSPSSSPSQGTPSNSPSEATPSDSPSGSPSEATPSGSPSGSPSVFYNVFTHDVSFGSNLGTATRTWRLRIGASQLTAHIGGRIRIKLSGSGYSISGCWIWEKATSGDLWDGEPGTGVAIPFGGSMGVHVLAADEWSDSVLFDVTGDKDLIVNIEQRTVMPYASSNIPTDCSVHYTSTINIGDDANVSGLSTWTSWPALVEIDGLEPTTPSASPSEATPSGSPSEGSPSGSPSEATPSATPSRSPSASPSASPSEATPSGSPSASPSEGTVSNSPSEATPSGSPSDTPSASPSGSPSASPSEATPSDSPSGSPSSSVSASPSASPSEATPSGSPSDSPSASPSASPSYGTPSVSPGGEELRRIVFGAVEPYLCTGGILVRTVYIDNQPIDIIDLEGTPSGGTPSGSPSEATPSGTASESPTASPSEATPSGSPSGFPMIWDSYYIWTREASYSGNYGWRTYIPASDINPHDGFCRIKFAWDYTGAEQPYRIEEMYIWRSLAGADAVEGTRVPVTKDGLTDFWVTGQDEYSDTLEFVCDGTTGVLITFAQRAEYTYPYASRVNGLIQYYDYDDQVFDEVGVADVSGYSTTTYLRVIDEIWGVDAPSPSPSIYTPSASPSPSPSGSPSASPSGSPSVTPSGSPSVTPSATPSGSPSATPSGSPSVTPSGSPSEATPSATPSGSPSVTPSGSPSGSPTASPSPTPSPSPDAWVIDVAVPVVDIDLAGYTPEYEIDLADYDEPELQLIPEKIPQITVEIGQPLQESVEIVERTYITVDLDDDDSIKSVTVDEQDIVRIDVETARAICNQEV